MDDQNRILAGLILNCQPEDLKAISMRADSSLAVVAPNGMKFIFSPVELENARDSFGLQEDSMPAASPPVTSTPKQQKALCGANASSVKGADSGASTSSAGGAGLADGRPKTERVEAGKQSSPTLHGKNRRQESRL